MREFPVGTLVKVIGLQSGINFTGQIGRIIGQPFGAWTLYPIDFNESGFNDLGLHRCYNPRTHEYKLPKNTGYNVSRHLLHPVDSFEKDNEE